jgi:putative ABC transport system permease protein
VRRAAHALICLLAPLAPRSSRARWLEEWHAEIDHASSALGGRRFASLRILRMALGAVSDIRAVRRLHRLRLALPITPSSRGSMFYGLAQDFRHACRVLMTAPGFSLAVIGSLALGIAVNAAAFAMVNALFFRILPGVEDQARLARIELCRASRHAGCGWLSTTYDDYTSMRTSVPSVQALAARVQLLAAARIRGEATTLRAALVSPNYFEVLGARLSLGAGFPAAKDASGDAVAVISHGLWQRQFEGAPDVLGEFIAVGTTAVRIVGVAPERFLGDTNTAITDGREIWLPFAVASAVLGHPSADLSARARREGEYAVEYVGRLAPGATLQQARSEANVFAARLVPGGTETGARPFARVRRFGFKDPDEAVQAFAIIMPLPLLVLAIACLNATSLLLARATYRMRDTTVRLALGATRWRIVRHVLTESLLLALAAAAASVPLTMWTIGFAQPHLPMSVPLDSRVLGFTVLAAAGSALIVGLLPALRASSRRGAAMLGSSRAGDTGTRAPRLRKVLVVIQVAASLALLATGGQSLSSVAALMSETGADDPERLLIASFDLDKLKFSEEEGKAFYRQVLERVVSMPQVEAAGLARPRAMWTFGLGSGSSAVVLWLPEEAADKGRWHYVGGYIGGDVFRAVGLKLLHGRGFAPGDARATPQVAIVNQPMADRLFSGAALGRSIRVAARNRHEESLEVRIVGIVEPTIERSYSGAEPVPAVYLPAPFQYEPALALYVRSRTSMETLLPELRAAVGQVDPRVPFVDVGTLQARFEQRNMEDHILASGATILGAVALLLATAGLYGLFSFIVSLRQREIGVRMALGAEPAAVLRLVLHQAMSLALLGAGIGAAIAIVAGAIVSAEIYGTASIDPLMFIASAAMLIVAMLAAGFVPAWRASRVIRWWC